jgi:hypothetical protein
VTRSELKRLFCLAWDDEMLKFLAQHIHDSYADSIERAASLDKDFRKRAVPQIRHYIIQNRVLYLPRHFPQVAAHIDYSDGYEPYTVLRSDDFYLTVSMAKEPGQLPRRSDFRQANATDNLFERFDPQKIESFYAILTHVPSWDNGRPEHLSIVFPDDGYTGVYECIDLTSLIEFELEGTETPSEDIDAPEPTLRKRLPKTSEEV